MVRLHPTAKKAQGGFVPMIAVRNPRGQMLGSRCPNAADRTVYATAEHAAQVAFDVACRVALRHSFVVVAS